MPQTFGDGALPWNHWYAYSVTNIDVPADYRPHVTVIYSGRNSDADQYLKYWFEKHPALKTLSVKTNFREMDTNDPVFVSALQKSIPQTPAVLVTGPADNGYFAKVAYLSYGEYLSTDPNEIAMQIQKGIDESQVVQKDIYEPQVQQTNLPPVVPRLPEPEPVVIEPVPEPTPDTILSADQTGLVVFGMIVAFVIASVNKRR